MEPSKLLGPDGKPVPQTMCVEFDGRVYPSRVVDKEVLNQKDPRVALMGVLVQMGDTDNLMWLAMLALAKDIYARDPKPSMGALTGPALPREFQRVAQQLGMVIIDRDRNELNVGEELSKI